MVDVLIRDINRSRASHPGTDPWAAGTNSIYTKEVVAAQEF
jgi:hypothetical protein